MPCVINQTVPREGRQQAKGGVLGVHMSRHKAGVPSLQAAVTRGSSDEGEGGVGEELRKASLGLWTDCLTIQYTYTAIFCVALDYIKSKCKCKKDN